MQLRMLGLLSAGLLVLGLGVLVAACAPEPDEPDEITVEIWFGREEFVPHDDFERFHEENPGIRVEYDVIPLEEAHTDFIRNHEAGAAPDVVQIFGEFISTMVAQGTLLDITEYIEQWEQDDPEDFADIYDITWDMASHEDRIYGLTAHSGPFFMGYRLDWFEEIGASEPESWEDMIEISRELHDQVLDGDQYAYSFTGGAHHPPFWMNSMFMSMGGQFRDSGMHEIDSEAGIFLIEWLQTMAREGMMDPEVATWASGDMRGAFHGGRAAFYPEAINVFAVAQNELVYGEEWEVMVQPPREGGEDDFVVNSFGWPFMVSSNTEHPEEVIKVLQYIFDPEIVIDVALEYQPANRESVMTSDAYYEAHPYFEKLEAAFAEQVPYPTHLRSPERSDILNQMKEEALTNLDASPEEIAARYQALLDELDE